jgi:hypothetical protein
MPAIVVTIRSRWASVRAWGSPIIKPAGTWGIPVLALAFYILTILFSRRSEGFSSVSVIGGSPHYPLRTLSALSILTTHIFLAATISQSFNSLRLWRIARRGLVYHEDLALQGATSKTGFLWLMFSCKTANWRARVWSILHLVAMILPSVLNFLLMSRPTAALEVYANHAKATLK